MGRRELMLRHAESSNLPTFTRLDLIGQLESAPDDQLLSRFYDAVSSTYLYFVHFPSKANEPEYVKEELLYLAAMVTEKAPRELRQYILLRAKLTLLNQSHERNFGNAAILFAGLPQDMWSQVVNAARQLVLTDFPDRMHKFEKFLSELEDWLD